MILVDFNQVCISNIMQDIKSNSDIEEDLVRHMILSSLLMYKQKFSQQYGELTICCDSPKSWRKEVFPFYKANRKNYRESSDFDWKKIFLILNFCSISISQRYFQFLGLRKKIDIELFQQDYFYAHILLQTKIYYL